MLQSSVAETVQSVPWRPVAVVFALLVVGVAVRRLLGRRLAPPVRRRLLLGIPWGTLLTAAGVLALYLFVQGAYWHGRPLVTPFRTWSYFDPVGMLLGPFTHAGPGHLTGNLLGTLVYGSVAEYAWGHYPRKRGVATLSSLRTNPFARILAVPVAMAVVGVFSGLFALGPVIGFSGVVFALAGFAVVTRPVLFLGALLANRVVGLVLRALLSPEPTVGGSVRFVTPGWANVAIQGHAIGLLAGVFLAAALLWARSERPDPGRLFFAMLVFAVSGGLWAVYVPLGGGRFRLFRWLGTIAVFLLALLVASATRNTDRRLLPDFEGGWPSLAGFALVVGLAALCLAAVPANLTTVGPGDVPEDGVEVRDYVVTYDEEVENAYFSNIPLVSQFREPINQSGVVVASDRREIWIATVPKERLATNGHATVVVGGVGWRETVDVNRTGWTVTGNESTYRVDLVHDGTRRTPFTSDAATVDGTVADRNVTVRPARGRFELVVERGGETVGTGAVPENTTSSRIGGLTFERDGSRLYAAGNGTRVPVARAGG
jgi:membrane associated rhomboid family serine protease